MGNRIFKLFSTRKPREEPDGPLDHQDRVLDNIVIRFLENENINNRYIPDAIERRMYRNVLKLVIGHLSEVVEGTRFDVLGHRISLSITPIPAAEPRPSNPP